MFEEPHDDVMLNLVAVSDNLRNISALQSAKESRVNCSRGEIGSGSGYARCKSPLIFGSGEGSKRALLDRSASF